MTERQTFHVKLHADAILPEDGAFELAPSDLDAPPVHMDVFAIFPNNGLDASKRQTIVQAVTTGLERTLDSIPILSGKFLYEPSLHVQTRTDSTVRLDVVDLQSDTSIPSYEILQAAGFDSTKLASPSLLPYPVMFFTNLATNKVKENAPVLYTQLSFIRGATILTISGHHHVVDNGTLNFILLTLAQHTKAAVQGTAVNSPAPSLDRTWQTPRILAADEVESLVCKVKTLVVKQLQDPPNVWFFQPNVNVVTMKFPPAKLVKLKERCAAKNTGEWRSTYDCVLAALWQTVVRARHTDPLCSQTELSSVYHPVSLRGKVPQVSSNYVGNSFALMVAGPVRVSELLGERGLQVAATASRASINAADLTSLNDFLSLKRTIAANGQRTDHAINNVNGLDILCTSWQGMDIDEYDFGFAKCVAVRGEAGNMNGACHICAITKQEREEQGVWVTLLLQEQYWTAVRQDKALLEFAEFA